MINLNKWEKKVFWYLSYEKWILETAWIDDSILEIKSIWSIFK